MSKPIDDVYQIVPEGSDTPSASTIPPNFMDQFHKFREDIYSSCTEGDYIKVAVILAEFYNTAEEFGMSFEDIHNTVLQIRASRDFPNTDRETFFSFKP